MHGWMEIVVWFFPRSTCDIVVVEGGSGGIKPSSILYKKTTAKKIIVIEGKWEKFFEKKREGNYFHLVSSFRLFFWLYSTNICARWCCCCWFGQNVIFVCFLSFFFNVYLSMCVSNFRGKKRKKNRSNKFVYLCVCMCNKCRSKMFALVFIWSSSSFFPLIN